MKTESLTKATHSAEFLVKELRDAYGDASKAGNEFYMLTLQSVIEDTGKLRRKIKRIADAVNLNGPTKSAITKELKKQRNPSVSYAS